MPKFDLNNLAKKVQKSAGGLAKAVADAAEIMPDVKAEDVTDAVKDATQKGQSVLNSVIARSREALQKKEEEKKAKEKNAGEESAPEREVCLTPPDALMVIYGLMSIDGSIQAGEADKFDLIGKELDPGYDGYKEELIQKCMLVTKDAADEQDRYDLILGQVSDIIKSAEKSKSAGIRGKLLLWDLYAIAYSDGHYDETEKRLIRFISRLLHIDSVIAMEMEQTLQTMITIEKEEAWLRTTDRQYQIVEARMNELADRKQVVMQGIQALIAD